MRDGHNLGSCLFGIADHLSYNLFRPAQGENSEQRGFSDYLVGSLELSLELSISLLLLSCMLLQLVHLPLLLLLQGVQCC